MKLKKLIIFALLLIFIFDNLFIKPVQISFALASWEKVSLENLRRGIVDFLIVTTLPGYIILKFTKFEDYFKHKFDISPIITKITFVPLLSLLFLGFSGIILDMFGSLRESFSIRFLIVFVILVILFAIFKKKESKEDNKEYILNSSVDLIGKNVKESENVGSDKDFINFYNENEDLEKKIVSKEREIKIPINVFLLCIVCIGIFLITLGFITDVPYLLDGDNWRGIQYAYFLHQPSLKPFETSLESGDIWIYSKYWGYISYSLYATTGIPYINANVFLSLYSYILFTSSYMMFKVIFVNKKDIYAFFAAIIMVFYPKLTLPYVSFNTSTFFSWGILIFGFRSFAYMYFNLSIMLIFNLMYKTEVNEKIKIFNKIEFPKDKIEILIFSVLFISQAFFIYFLPLIPILIFIFIYIVLSKNKENIKYITLHLYLLTFFVFVIDLIGNFFFSMQVVYRIIWFVNFNDLIMKYHELKIIIVIIFYVCTILFIKSINMISNLSDNSFWNKLNRIKQIFQDNKVRKITNIIIFCLCLFIISSKLILNEIKELPFILYFIDVYGITFGFFGFLYIYLLNNNPKITSNRKIAESSDENNYMKSELKIKNNSEVLIEHRTILLVFSIIIFVISSLLLLFYGFPYIFSNSIININEDSLFKGLYWFNRLSLNLIIPISFFNAEFIIDHYKKRNKHADKSPKVRNSKLIKNKNQNCRMFKLLLKKPNTPNTHKVIKKISIVFLILYLLMSPLYVSIRYSNQFRRSQDYVAKIQIVGWIAANVPPEQNILIDRHGFEQNLKDVAFVNSIFKEEFEQGFENNSGNFSLGEYLYNQSIFYFITKINYIDYEYNYSAYFFQIYRFKTYCVLELNKTLILSN